MIENNFEQLVTALNISPLSTDVLRQITLLLKQQTNELLSTFVSQSFQSLLILECWAWQLFSQDSHQWVNEPNYQELFHTLASFNKDLIFSNDNIEVNMKSSLLFSVTIDEINDIFQHIEQSADDNDPFITIASLWFDNHSHFIYDTTYSNVLPITDHINTYIIHNYVMSEQFKFYLTQLQQSPLAESVFTAKLLFYIKTCSFSLFSYVRVRVHSFPYTADDMLRYFGDDYIQIVHVHSQTVASWSRKLLTCMTHLISFAAGCCCWDGQKLTQTKILFPTEQMMCDHVQDLINIIGHRPFQKQIEAVRSNDETILMDVTLLILATIVHTQNINWYFRSNSTIKNVLSSVAEISLFDKVCLGGYALLGEVLSDEQLKDLKIVETIGGFFFNILEHAWHHPSKIYKQLRIEYLLRGFSTLAKHDFIQQQTADLNKIPLLIEISEQYPAVYDILWALSFNQDIQQQLRSNASFMSNLYHLAKECDNKQMRKTIHGLLWNLESNHKNRSTSENNDEKSFDIMISYSHKDKTLCQQIYEELTKAGYRAWIDFDQMHGNVMDAMAQAIERSDTIIICMSEQYRRSNYCRAEAQYAFQHQRKIVPVLLEKHYKPDGWLLFLIGQLLYVDFIKYEFNRAMEMLFKELKAEDFAAINVSPIRSKEETNVSSPVVSVSLSEATSSSTLPHNILEWTQIQVQEWLVEHNLIQMSRLLADCNGRSLIYLSKCVKHVEFRCILSSLQEDSLRRTNQNLSFIEFSCFLSLMDQQKRLNQSTSTNKDNTKNNF